MKQNKLMLIAGLILVLAVVIEGFYIFDLRNQINNKILTNSDSIRSQALKHNWFDEENNQLFDVFKDFDEMQREMDQLFGRFSLNNRGNPYFDNVFGEFSSSPAMDFIEEQDQYVIRVDLPGAEDNSIDIRVDNGRLTLSAKTIQHKDEDKSNYKRSERFSGKLQRTLSLPPDANSEEMTTTMENGVLKITIPKIM
ncbi:MAG: Hsp20/alpha crystallin family protein [Candidatus Marinimicrobia bacterium]|nr:Hsp20/alpha crystallin family protein [FCB group bacterium]MBL7023953.1 Hsp20/alpha crystallin family protein [Candidatus Neomarinimicrobiota bacterium]